MPVPVTLTALQDQVLLPVVTATRRAAGEAGTGRTLCVVVLPLAPEACRRGPAVPTPHTPETQEPPHHLSWGQLVPQERTQETEPGKSSNADPTAPRLAHEACVMRLSNVAGWGFALLYFFS